MYHLVTGDEEKGLLVAVSPQREKGADMGGG